MFYFIFHIMSFLILLIVSAVFCVLNGFNSMAVLIFICNILYVLITALELFRYKRIKQESVDEKYTPSKISKAIFISLRFIMTLPIIYGFYKYSHMFNFKELPYMFAGLLTLATLYTLFLDIQGTKALKNYSINKINDEFIRGKIISTLYYTQGMFSFLSFFSILDYFNFFGLW